MQSGKPTEFPSYASSADPLKVVPELASQMRISILLDKDDWEVEPGCTAHEAVQAAQTKLDNDVSQPESCFLLTGRPIDEWYTVRYVAVLHPVEDAEARFEAGTAALENRHEALRQAIDDNDLSEAARLSMQLWLMAQALAAKQ